MLSLGSEALKLKRRCRALSERSVGSKADRNALAKRYSHSEALRVSEAL